MIIKHSLALSAALSACFAIASAQDAPLIKPGAPGEASRVITPEESVALGETVYTEADVTFMQDMIVHHGQAVEMVAMIPARSVHEGVKLMGQRITLTQAAEIEMMQTWLRVRGESTESSLLTGEGHKMDHGQMDHGEDHDHGMMEMGKEKDPMDVPLMHGMLSPRQMMELEASTGEEFDRLFLSGMIQHHQGALDMVDMLMEDPDNGQDPLLSEFLSAVIADQSAEIIRMQHMLSAMAVSDNGGN